MTKINIKAFMISFFFWLPQSIAAAEQGWPPAGFWNGNIEYNNTPLEIRVDIRENEDGLAAFLDIPALVYAGQPISIDRKNENTITLDFPFGIGKIDLTPETETSAKGTRGAFSVTLEQTAPPAFRKVEITFGAIKPEIQGTVYLPQGQGPFATIVQVAGSGGANRSQWSYSSWADFYVRLGYAVLVYDRRPEMTVRADGALLDFYDHAADIADAISRLRKMPEIGGAKIGLAGHSRGVWFSLATTKYVHDLDFMIFLSPAAATPGEQEVASVLTGMEQDGLSTADIAAARSYLRLYFYVAATGEGWDLLAMEMEQAKNSIWFQYVDQPRSIEDLAWWRAHMDFPAREHLKQLDIPVLALWGGDDFITPWAEYQGKLVSDIEKAGNTAVTTHVFRNADHRLEIDPGEDDNSVWHWFGMAPGVLQTIQDWLQEQQ